MTATDCSIYILV